MWITGSKERVTKEQMLERIEQKLEEGRRYELYVGTDSMVHAKSKVVTVVALVDVGHGGIFFSKTQFIDRFHTLRAKIYKETEESLEMAGIISKMLYDKDLDYEVHIHSDIGENGPTKELIPEIVGWIKGLGYECSIKPFLGRHLL